jgi:hypothetical protein
MSHDEEALLICAPADAELTVPGATFNRVCSKCSRRVMLSPTSERVFKEFRKVMLVCSSCFFKGPIEGPILIRQTEEQVAEMRTCIPNLWRRRN